MDRDNLAATARVIIRKPPQEVFGAFSDAGQMSKFWFSRDDKGLEQGQRSTWSIGTGEAAFSFDVMVKELNEPHKLVIEWVGPDEVATLVTWTFEETDSGDTVLSVEETGFTGSTEAVVARALDSTGGFNQVIIAAKALLEHGVAVNVVADHA